MRFTPRFWTVSRLFLCSVLLSACLTQEKSGTQVTLSWSAIPGEQDGFKIERSADGVHFVEVQSVPEGTYTAKVVGIGRGMTYTFRIRGYNAGGISPYSKTVSVAIPAAK